jgi:hypothetical protein
VKRDTEILKQRTKDFALRVLRLYRSLPRSDEARILGTQLPAEKLAALAKEANELASIFVSSLRTAKGVTS